jgi:hypothetical protein
MTLITRQGKGSKLTIQEMDGNLEYLESLGLSGTSYVFVSANNGTDSENADELQRAYNLAATKKIVTPEIITITGDSFIVNKGGLPYSANGNPALTVNSTYSYWLDGVNYSGRANYNDLMEEYSLTCSAPDGIYNSLEIEFLDVKKSTVLVAPGYYNFSSDFILDEEYVDLVSLDGNRSIIFNGTGTISLTANNVFVKGVDVMDKPFLVSSSLSVNVENCIGGDNSFSKVVDRYVLSGTFTNCEGGSGSFADIGEIKGKLYFCKLTSGFFQDVSDGGRTYFCIDGEGNINNQ